MRPGASQFRGHQILVERRPHCQGSSEPALRELWRKQSSLDPLFLLLPKDLWGNEVVHGEIDDSESDNWDDKSELEDLEHDYTQPTVPPLASEPELPLEFKRPVIAADLQRYHFYKDKIKCISMVPHEDLTTSFERKHIELVRLAFELHIPGENYLPALFLLDLRGNVEWIRSEILSRKLRIFECNQVINKTALQSLAALPRIHTLEICFPPVAPASPPVSSVSKPFPSLKSLHVTSKFPSAGARAMGVPCPLRRDAERAPRAAQPADQRGSPHPDPDAPARALWHIGLDTLGVSLSTSDSRARVELSAGVQATNLAVKAMRGWVTGEVALVNSTTLSTSGDTVTNVHSGGGELYLTYADAQFSGRVAVSAQSYSMRGVQSEGGLEGRGKGWVGDKEGGDSLTVANARGWVGVYF
ncbi:hypothetical protein HWV62_19873 [Athelia sp. TMB]|nr:hypothetical protein HWV62_19873 [Athelia sp. TMB]